jgi:hypothetical protein
MPDRCQRSDADFKRLVFCPVQEPRDPERPYAPTLFHAASRRDNSAEDRVDLSMEQRLETVRRNKVEGNELMKEGFLYHAENVYSTRLNGCNYA